MSFWEGFIQNVALGLTMEYRVHWNWQARINFFLRMGLFHPYLLRKWFFLGWNKISDSLKKYSLLF